MHGVGLLHVANDPPEDLPGLVRVGVLLDVGLVVDLLQATLDLEARPASFESTPWPGRIQTVRLEEDRTEVVTVIEFDAARRTWGEFAPHLYRLDAPGDAYELGIEDAFTDGISLIEWPERLGDAVPDDWLLLHLTQAEDPESRRATITAHGPKSRVLAECAVEGS